MRVIEGIKLYTEKNKISKLSQPNIDDLAVLYQKQISQIKGMGDISNERATSNGQEKQ